MSTPAISQADMMQNFAQFLMMQQGAAAAGVTATPPTPDAATVAAAAGIAPPAAVTATVEQYQQAFYQAQQQQQQAFVTPAKDTKSRALMQDEEDTPGDAKRAKWTTQEDEMLRGAVQQNGGRNWKKIAQSAFGGNKTDVQCLHRWQKVLDPKLVKGPWTAAEDAKVVSLVEEHGPQKWSLIASHLPGRIGKQCRERWHNHLNPSIKKDQWTPEEDQIILTLHQTLGNQWAVMSEMMKKCGMGYRPDNAIKNRWNSSMKRRHVAQPATTEENGMIMLPGIGLVALPVPGEMNRDGDDSEDDDEDRPKKKAVKRKAPSSARATKESVVAAAAAAAATAVEMEDGDEKPVVTSATKPKKLTKRQEASLASSASKAQAKKERKRDTAPASAPTKKTVRKAAAATTPPAAARTSTRPQRSVPIKNWADQLETDSDDEGEIMSEEEDEEMAAANREHARADSSSESEIELPPLRASVAPPSTPAHRRSNTAGSATPFLATPQLRTPARVGRSSISPGLLGGGMEEKKAYSYADGTPMRLSSPSHALSLASPSAQLLSSPNVAASVFSPPVGGQATRLQRPLSTPLTNQARFHSLMHPRTPASPSHHLHPANALSHGMSMSHMATPASSRMLSMGMGLGLHLMSSPGPAAYMHAAETDALTAAHASAAAMGHDALDNDEPLHKKQKISVLSSPQSNGSSFLTGASPFINLATRPLLHTPRLRYNPLSTTPGFTSNTNVPASVSASATSPGFESFFQSPQRLLNRTASQRGKRGLDFAADTTTPSSATTTTPNEGFLSPPPLHSHPAPMTDVPTPLLHSGVPIAAGIGAASVQQLLSHLKSQAAQSGSGPTDEPPSTPSPLLSAVHTPSTVSTVSTSISYDETPVLTNARYSTRVGVVDAPVVFDRVAIEQAADEQMIDNNDHAESHSEITGTPVQKKSTRNTRRTAEIMGSPLALFAAIASPGTLC